MTSALPRPWRIRPLGGGRLGIELADATPTDLARPSHARSLAALLARHGVVLVRDALADATALERVAAALGTVETVHPAGHRLPGTERVRLQSNLPGHGVNGGGMYWHADGSWMRHPTAVTLLACREAPRSSGATAFVDARALYRGLDAADRELCDTAVGVYPNRRILARELAALGISAPEMLADAADATHPLVRTHPATGERALVLNEQWLAAIAGMPATRSAALLARLSRAAEACPERCEHAWTAGDLLLWDNRIVVHRAEPTSASERKVTWRITVRALHGEAAVA